MGMYFFPANATRRFLSWFWRITVRTWAMDKRTTLILESLLGAPPVTFATRRAASSVLSSLSWPSNSPLLFVRSSCTLKPAARFYCGLRDSGGVRKVSASGLRRVCRTKRLPLPICHDRTGRKRFTHGRFAGRRNQKPIEKSRRKPFGSTGVASCGHDGRLRQSLGTLKTLTRTCSRHDWREPQNWPSANESQCPDPELLLTHDALCFHFLWPETGWWSAPTVLRRNSSETPKLCNKITKIAPIGKIFRSRDFRSKLAISSK